MDYPLLLACVVPFVAMGGCDKSNSVGEVQDSGADESAAEAGDDDGQGDDGATSVGDGGSDTGDTPEITCDPGSSYYEPPGCAVGPGPSLIEAGCFRECTGNVSACGEGETCQTVQYNPCPCPPDAEACCGACGAETQVCMPGEFDTVCASIIGKQFRSIEEYDCGLGKDGPIPCHWRLGFSSDGELNWNYTDISLSADYTCINGVLDPDLDVITSFDLETLTLTWDGVDYQADVE